MATPTVTLADVRTVVYDNLREDQNDTTYSATLIDSFINLAQRKFCSGRIIHPISKEDVKK